MKSPLHTLHLEDNPNDPTLIQSAPEAGGITCATKCVQERDVFVAALEVGAMAHIGTVAKALCAFGHDARSPNHNLQGGYELITAIVNSGIKSRTIVSKFAISLRIAAGPSQQMCHAMVRRLNLEGLNI